MASRYFSILPAIILLLTINHSFAQVPIDPVPVWHSYEQNMYSTGMIWDDCNNDGYIDVFYSNGNDIVLAPNTIYISNNGILPEQASWQSDNLEYSGHCAVGDINDDGWPDFAVSNYLGQDGFSSANLSDLYLNNSGLPSTSPDWYTADSIYTFSCAFGDANGDGLLDLALATGDGYYDKNIQERIYFNLGGSLDNNPGWKSAYPTQAMDVTWGDVDSDGDLDLAFCYDDRPPAIHYNNDGLIDEFPSWQASNNESANTLIFADVNNDTWLDLVVAFNDQHGGGGYYCVYYNDGTGIPSPVYGWQSSDGGYGSAISVYDYDNDGDDDLAAGRWWDRPRVYENISGSFTIDPVWRANFSTVVEEMAWVDVDGNGLESRFDTLTNVAGKKVYYARHHPLYSIDSVLVDGSGLNQNQYCYDLVSGWVSVGVEPVTEIVICYQYSFTNDLAISNWDTLNFVYGNTNRAPVDFYSDIHYGQVPLTVQFTDSSVGATGWLWDFGDNSSSYEQNPLHLFVTGGMAYDIHLENVLADGPHNRTQNNMIITLADTLYFPDMSVLAGSQIKLPIYLTNAFPVNYFTLPLIFDGPSDLSYLGFDTDSCRTDYFYSVELVTASPSLHKLAFTFDPGIGERNPPLEAGSGRVINVYFAPSSSTGVNYLDSTTINNYSLNLETDLLEYSPFVSTGSITILDYVCGDANGDISLNLADAAFIINYIFNDGPTPDPMNSGDANGDTDVNMADASYIINYIFYDGPDPICM